jgi:hypothetical protein
MASRAREQQAQTEGRLVKDVYNKPIITPTMNTMLTPMDDMGADVYVPAEKETVNYDIPGDVEATADEVLDVAEDTDADEPAFGSLIPKADRKRQK